MPLHDDGRGEIVQAFPLIVGKVNKTSGTIPQCRMIACVSDGNFTVSKLGENIDAFAGDVFSFDVSDVTINSGKFHLA